MPRCPYCGNQLTGSEQHCPACGQSTEIPSNLPGPTPALASKSLPLGNYIKIGWQLFKQYPGGFVGFCLVNIAVHLALHALPRLSWLVSAGLSAPLFMGNFIVSAKLLQRQTPVFRDFFSGFYFFWPLFLLSLLVSVLIGIGMVLLVIPGVYLMVGYFFASPLVVDRRLDFWPAMELSRRTANPIWFSLFAFLLLLTVINLVGLAFLGLGFLITLPLTFCYIAAAYSDLFGFQSDYSQEVPRLKTP